MSSCHTLSLGALLAAAGVALGAYGAHGLEDRLIAMGFENELTKRLAWFDTGVRYQLYHALGLIVTARVCCSRWVAVAFLLGIVLFSGSLYAMTFLSEDWSKLGAVVPVGGLSFIVGWCLLAYSAWHSNSE